MTATMTTIYAARWILPDSAAPIENGAVAVEAEKIVAVGSFNEVSQKYGDASIREFKHAAIIPGLINSHTHLELTAMRGYLENEESNFFAWLRKLTVARLERMTQEDILVSATMGACEALRAGVTAVADASDSAAMSMLAINEVGLRGIVFQESFGPDPRLVDRQLAELKVKVLALRQNESELVKVGVSPHAPYTVCGPQLEQISDFAISENLPLMMHAAESAAEDLFLREGSGIFAEGLAKRNIEWTAPRKSAIQYLRERKILETKPLLAHCVRLDDRDIEILNETGAKVAHCPKSNAKLGHGRAPFARFLDSGLSVGLGSDSVASNNTCDILEEARFAALVARSDAAISPADVLKAATLGGAQCFGLSGTVGELTPGAQADLAIIALDGPHQVPCYDPMAVLIFASSGRDVVMTVVAGKEVYRDGQVVGVDEERLKARMREIAKKLGR